MEVSVRTPLRRAKELMNITETPDGNAVLLVADDVVEGHTDEDADHPAGELVALIDSCLVLSRSQIMTDAESIPLGDSRRVSISIDPEHEDAVTVIRILLTEDSTVQALVYFGGRASAAVSLRTGLIHAAEILAVVDRNLFEDMDAASAASRSGDGR